MRSRRGEVSFVAVRVGRSNDPREVLSLARELKTNRATALGFVVLWEEFLLEVGDSLTGRVRGYTAEHIAAKLDWDGSPRRLIDALKNAGVLKTQRNVFFHPYWVNSITGQYARERAELREQWREKKRRQREGGEMGDVPAVSPGHLGDVPPLSPGKPDINQLIKGNGDADAPPTPPGAGGSRGHLRWAWMLQNHPRPANSRACLRYLEAMNDEAWALCQWVWEQFASGGLSTISRKKRALRLDSHRFLANEAYLEFRRERVEKLRPKNGAQKPGAPPVPTVLVTGDDFVMAQLEDPDLSDVKKESIRRLWRLGHPGQIPPWEKPSIPSTGSDQRN